MAPFAEAWLCTWEVSSAVLLSSAGFDVLVQLDGLVGLEQATEVADVTREALCRLGADFGADDVFPATWS